MSEEAAKLANGNAEAASSPRVLAAAGFQHPREEGAAEWPPPWQKQGPTQNDAQLPHSRVVAGDLFHRLFIATVGTAEPCRVELDRGQLRECLTTQGCP